MMRSIVTRFRAYQLGVPGSSFSHFADGHFTVIEGRLTEFSKVALVYEMHRCGVEFADMRTTAGMDAAYANDRPPRDATRQTITPDGAAKLARQLIRSICRR
jgi:hypothetical protein